MKLTQEQKDKITTEYEQWKEKMYAGKSKEERQKMGQFFTPPELSIKMIEKFDNIDTDWLDPTIGAGNLIAAVIMAGADPTKCYGNELDPDILEICRQRLEPLGVPHKNLHQGNALYRECIVLESFTDDYDWKTLEPIAAANAAKEEETEQKKVDMPKTGFGAFFKK